MDDGGDGMMKLGAVGGSRVGNVWDEKGHDKIAQIFISHSDQVINSIQFQYVEDGRLKLSKKHGSSVGNKFDAVRLKPATEYITRINGHTNSGCLRSITFGTNHGKYGPFGTSGGDHDKEFYFNLGRGGGEEEDPPQFGGFHGTASSSVNSIGIYLNPSLVLDNKGKNAYKYITTTIKGL